MAAATSYSTVPASTYAGHRSHGDPYQSSNFGTYDSGIGSLTSHPYQYETNSYGTNINDSHQQSLYPNDYLQPTHSHNDYSTQHHHNLPTNTGYSTQHHQNLPTNTGYSTQQHQNLPTNTGYSTQQHQNLPTNKYAQQSTNHQQKQLNTHSNPQTPKTDDRSIATNNNTGGYATKKTTQPTHKKNMDNHHVDPKNHQQTSYANKTQHHPPAPVDNQHHQSQSNLVRSERQITNQPPKKQQQQQPNKPQPPPPPPFQSKLSRSENQISKVRQTPPLIHHRSPSNGNNNYPLEKAPKKSNTVPELKPTKSSQMRAAANKKKEVHSEQKRKEQFFPSGPVKTKPHQTSSQTDFEQSDAEKTKLNKPKQSKSLSTTRKHPHTDGEQSDAGKKTRDKKQSHSQPVQRKSRRDNYQTEDNNSSGDDDKKDNKHHRSKSQKRTTFSDKHPHLPPLRHGRLPPHYDPYLDYPMPPGHPLRGRFPYHDDYPPYVPYHGLYSRRHLYEDADDIPPYLGPYHDPYDGFFDYEKRKAKPKHRTDPHTDHEDNHGGTNGYETEREDGTKSQRSRKSRNKSRSKSRTNENGGRRSRRDYEDHRHPHWPPGYHHPGYYDREDALELWRQERNDYLKRKFKPTIHDVLYSQQWMKSDSYLENQKRRTLRDVQGYYFPYKKYTLKDYKDLQKVDTQNPFSDVNEITIDRKERAKKRQEYGALVERHIADNPGTRQIPQRDMPPRKPWHLSGGETQDSEKASKRDRAIEYAKEQVKYRPVNSNKNSSQKSDPTEQYINDLYPEMNDDDNDQTSRNNQLYDDYD